MENQIFELQYAIDTFYFLVCGALVMWMAAGFAMLEAGLVRAKNTTEILTKNVALFAIACLMYLVCGYSIMYGGGIFLNGIEAFDLAGVLADSAEAGFDGGSVYSGASDFFFQVVFVATAMSIVSGAYEAVGLPGVRGGHDRFHLPDGRRLDLGRRRRVRHVQPG